MITVFGPAWAIGTPRFTVIVLLPSAVSGLVITSDINRSSARAK
jgi:hypothetical protein